MANHENAPNSGFSPGAPSRRVPDCGKMASTTATSVRNATRYTYHPAKAAMIVSLATVSACDAASGNRRVQPISRAMASLPGIATRVLKPR